MFLCPTVSGGTTDSNSNRFVDLFFMLSRKELANLDKFREHQKMIEELNARKKKMLSEAIKQR